MQKIVLSALFAGYLIAVIWIDQGLVSVLKFVASICVIGVVLFLAARLRNAYLMHAPGIVLLLAVIGTWVGIVGTSRIGTDIGFAVLGVVVASLIMAEPRRWLLGHISSLDRSKGHDDQVVSERNIQFSVSDIKFVALATAVAWILVSIHHDWFKVGPLITDPNRFVELEQSPGAGRLGLALSGGGYRAALYHAGVLKGLEDRGIRVSVISAVSGGSIIGAFYALGGDPSDFLQAVKDGRFNVKRELVMLPTALQLFCPGRLPFFNVELLPFCDFSRLDVQTKVLDDVLFGGAKLLEKFEASQPRMLLNTSDIYHGTMLGFSSDFLVAGNLRTGNAAAFQWDKLVFFDNPSGPRISEIVSMSGSFPGAFPISEIELEYRDSVPEFSSSVEAKRLKARTDLELIDLASRRLRFLLTDGGVFDNSGLNQLINVTAWTRTSITDFPEDTKQDLYLRGEVLGNEWRIDGAIVSNGGQGVDRQGSVAGLGAIVRSVELSSTINQERIRGSLIAMGNARTAYLAPELYDDIWFNPATQFSQRSGILPEDGFHLRLEGAGQRELRRASERSWPRWTNPEEATRAACILPNRAEAMRKLAAIRTELTTGILPYPILQERLRDGSENPGIGDIPAWDKDFESLRSWMDGGNCDDENYESLFSTQSLGKCEVLDLNLDIAHDIERSKKIFDSSDTLKDQYSVEEADALFRLGQYSVVLRWGNVQYALSGENSMQGDSEFVCPTRRTTSHQ